MLKVAVSARALFNLEDGHAIFKAQGGSAFDAYMRENENKPLRKGVAFNLVQKLLKLNVEANDTIIEVTLISRNTVDAGMRVLKSLQHYGLAIPSATFTGGDSRLPYLVGMQTDLLLSAHAREVRQTLEAGIAAAHLVGGESTGDIEDDVVRIAFDGDAVLFSDAAERVNQAHGLEAFYASEIQKAEAGIPLDPGPFQKVLAAFKSIRENPATRHLLKIALATARDTSAHERVVRTLREWGTSPDVATFASGRTKSNFLKAFRADIFFDDGKHHIEAATANGIASGHVLHGVLNEEAA